MITARIAAVGVLGAVILAGAGCDGSAAQLDELRTENARLQTEHERLSLALTAAEAKDKESQNDIRGLNHGLSEAAARLSDLSQQVESAKLTATEAQARFEEAASKLAAAETKIGELQSALEHSLQEAGDAAERYRLEVESLRAEINDLQAQLAAAIKALQDADKLRGLLPK